MTHEEILKKAVNKAKESGYHAYELPTATANHEEDIAKAALLTKIMRQDFALMIIFRHDFAKAFWGKAQAACNCKKTAQECPTADAQPGLKMWQYHLQQMVLSEDPIKYLEQFL